MLANVLTFATLAAASSYPRGQYIDANYDDIAAVPAVPAATPLGVYKGLNYTGFAVDEGGVDGAGVVAGVAAHSPPNQIVTGFEQTSLTGANAGWQVENKAGSFDLYSFYYGCAVNSVEGAEGVPQQCTFNVRGYRRAADANPVAQQQFSFTPKTTAVLAQAMQATFENSFSNIQRVEVVQLESTSGEELNVILLDDVVYNLYSKAQY
ncbi:Hypothetical predicted protein [Lecanosticta acicola]|uniref:DUF7371 domain-containing protein n=1 Tax=Lecanosticta acicola TaxID=111012 RepID=A0AAI8Z786_9PEZI|nr:Hypothetical predicted protein [Lecanosticta acicola]